MNKWMGMDEWLILKKKPACVHIGIIIIYKIKAKNNIKKKPNKQERPLTLKLTGIVETPRENSEMFENVKVSNEVITKRTLNKYF